MYLKQTEWCKWAAADEIKRANAESTGAPPTASPPSPSTPVKAPVTPQADCTNDDLHLLPPLVPTAVPVTPSKHVAASEAAARAIQAPGQPRKTPKGKRTKADIEDDSEEDDEISALPMQDNRPVGSRLPRTSSKPTR